METLQIVIKLLKMIEDENVAIKQAQLDEIKLCVCFIKCIW